MSLLLRNAFLLCLGLGLLPTLSAAQNRSCQTTELHETKLQDPEYAKAFRAKLKRILELEQNQDRALCADPVTIPVAIHFQNATNPDAACLIALAQNQIAIVNADLQGSNADITNWINDDSPLFPGVDYSETCVEFCIASQNHPSGFGLSNGDLAVTINQTSGSNNSAWSGYLNIWVRNIGALGFSPLGGDGDGDGVTIDNGAFGSGAGCNGFVPGSPYDLGRTLTHELGHYLLLGHIWGGGCASDDGVADTPDQSTSNGGCPSASASSCGSLDMHMNYMDYTNDACMYMFSQGQGTRMENYVASSLNILTSNAANVCGTGGPPTCTDGVQNGNETGVDCGGPDCPTCPIVYCTSEGQTTQDEWIESVTIGTFSNVSGDNNGYADFTNMPFDMEQNVSTNFVLTPDWDGTIYSEYFRIWVDLNLDGDFDDSGEMLYDQGSANNNATQTGSITIPLTSIIGETRMRVSMKYNAAPAACETFQYGEVEDYLVNITPPLAPINNLCSGAIEIFGGTFPGTLINATNAGNPSGSCNGLAINGPTVWYKFTSSGNELYDVDVCGAPIDTRLHLFSGNCDGNLICEIANDNFCGDDGAITYTTPNTAAAVDYYLLVSGANEASSTFVLNVALSPLPVELIGFNGEAKDDGNLLRWKTANEVDLEYYSIERSNDLEHWVEIGRKNPTGTAFGFADYSLLDEQPESFNYYRLVSTNFDRSASLSEVLRIERPLDKVTLNLFPNPASEFINIQVTAPGNIEGKFIVRSIDGKEIYEELISWKRGEQRLKIDVNNWTPGVYFIQWELDGTIRNDRFVKQ